MILSHLEFSEPIVLDESCPTVWVIENPRLFRQWVQMLILQCAGEEGDFVLSHENEVCNFEKQVHLVRDILFDSELEDDVNRALLKRLEQLARNEYVHETQKIEQALLKYSDLICQDLSVDFNSADSIDIRALVKLLEISPDWEDELLPRLCSQMRLAQDFLHKELHILINCKSYLSEEELLALYKEYALHQARLLLIESHQSPPLNEEQLIIIDKDLCELRFSSPYQAKLE